MKKKISIIVLCLMLLTIALAGAAEGKQKAEILNKKPLLMYCPEEGKDDPEFDTYESFYFEIQPAGKYDLQLEYAKGDEALFEAISARQYRKDDKSIYIDAEVFPKEPCVTIFRLTGESEDAYIDELFEIQVVPYTGRVTQERVDVQVQTGETVRLWEACFEELAGENSPISVRYFNVADIDKAGKYSLKWDEFTADEAGIYHVIAEAWNRNILERVNIRVIAGDVSEEAIKADTEAGLARAALDEPAEHPGKLRARIDSYLIRQFRRGVPFYCKSDEFPDIKLENNVWYRMELSREGNFRLKLDLVEGDSFIKNLFGVRYSRGYSYLSLKNAANLTQPGSAVLRITGEKDNYYVDETFTVNLVPFHGPLVELRKDYVHVNLDEATDVAAEFADLSTVEDIGYGFVPKNGTRYKYGDIENENFAWKDYEFRAFRKGIYEAKFRPSQANIDYEFDVKIYAGDYPYILSTDGEAYPGAEIHVLADPLMDEAKDREIEYAVEGNEKVSINSEGLLTIAGNASGDVLVKAKPSGMDVEPSELKVKILGYDGKKAEDEFDEETRQAFDYLEGNPLYSTESGSVWDSWQGYNNIGISLGLNCGEKVTKATVLPVHTADELKELLVVNPKAKGSLVINQSVLRNLRAGTAYFLVTAESQSHYAQKLVTLNTKPYSDPVEPEIKAVLFVKPGESVNLLDSITARPEGCVCVPLIESDQKGQLTSSYSHETGKKDVDLIPVSNEEVTYTSYSEGYDSIGYQFTKDNLLTLLTLQVVCSDTLTEADFAFTIPDVEMAAGQKVTLNPEFANAELVNRERKNDTVYLEGDTYNILTLKDLTITAQAKLDKLEEVELEATSRYCPSQKTTVLVRVHPKATAINASVETERLFLVPGKDTVQIQAAAEPGDAMQKFKYTSSNSKVASVDENGLITAVGAGKCTITVAAEDGSQKKKTVNISVLEPVTGISLEAQNTTVQAGKSVKIKAALTPEKPSDRKISWEVKEPEFAEFVRISNEGVVNVQAKCPSGRMTVLAKAEGALPDQEVKAEIIIEITGK